MNEEMSLNGDWTFHEIGEDNWKNGVVPGCVQLDLIRLGELEDPFYGLNDWGTYGLEEKEWIYQKQFEFNRNRDDYRSIRLIFEGLDTFADIYLNDRYIGKADNMYIPFQYEVKQALREGTNVLEVRFYSTMKEARALEAASAYDLAYCLDSSAPYVRKAHYSFGWDWSPRLIQTGLWRSVSITCISSNEIVSPFCYTKQIMPDKAIVAVEAEVDGPNPDELKARITISLNNKVIAQKIVSVGRKREKYGITAEMEIPDPQLWYPNGSGEQPLYDVNIQLLRDQVSVCENTFKTGVRIARVIREKDAEGESFNFEINGKLIFAKGANWIPADNLLPRVTAADYYAYVKAAKDANMNMFNVWGGGIYEDKTFYEACDEMGIMVWQTFMFHFAQYPDHTDWFQKLVRDEAETVVKQLRNHPSIVLWCGECESIWFFSNESKYYGQSIYYDLLPQALAQYDPSRSYWPGNPYGGKDANSMNEGDRHSWDVWLKWEDYELYKKDTARMVTEFGAQGMPDWRTVQSWTPEGELSLLSPTTISHNKLPEGMERLIRFMVGRLGFPKDFRSFCYLSQFNQAEAIKTAVEHWRSRKFSTGGTLFWMFNDCWPNISWSCIDYYKRKKGLFYYARDFYANVLPLLKVEDQKVVLDIVSDELTEAGLDIRVAAYKVDGTKRSEVSFSTTVAANSVTRTKEWTLEDLGIGFASKLFPTDDIFSIRILEKNGELMDTALFVEVHANGNTYRNYLVTERFRNLQLMKPNITVTTEGNEISLTADVPVFGLFIVTEEDVDLSDNCLNLEPGVTYTVTSSEKPGNIEVVSLFDLRADLV